MLEVEVGGMEGPVEVNDSRRRKLFGFGGTIGRGYRSRRALKCAVQGLGIVVTESFVGPA